MWEAISSVLNSSNGSTVLAVLLICIFIAYVLVKGGLLSVHTDAIRVGARDVERNVIKQQLDYVWSHLEEAEANLPKGENYDPHLGREIILEVYKEYSNWISFNHISRSEEYIRVKQNSLVMIVNKLTKDERYKSEEFKEYIRQDTQKTILELIEIREVYSK